MKGSHFFGCAPVAHLFVLGEDMMRSYNVAFIGHRRIEREFDLVDRIEGLVSELLKQHEYVEFLVGRNGDFDIAAASAVKRAQARFGRENSSLNLVLPYHVKDEGFYADYYDTIVYPVPPDVHFKAAIKKRNEWMLGHANHLIAYVKIFSGGAYAALEYARARKTNFINLAYI